MQAKEISIVTEKVTLQGLLSVPKGAKGIILFAHGSGSGRFSPRNQFVASVLSKGGFATLLMDLLTPQEDEIDELTRQLRFNIPLLADRLVAVTDWVKANSELSSLKVGYFGASTGAAAALIAASRRPAVVKSCVSRGGRPDLAESAFSQVIAPTLLIVGGDDFGVIELNQSAYDELACTKKLEIIPGATHLFEEPGALEMVAKIALNWYSSTLK